MIVLSNSDAQTIPVGGGAVFDTVLLKTNCREYHRKNGRTVRLSKGNYILSFNGNIAVPTEQTPGEISMVMSLGNDDILAETSMVVTPGDVAEFNNISATTGINVNCCDFNRVTVAVVNTSTIPITLGEKPSFVIREV